MNRGLEIKRIDNSKQIKNIKQMRVTTVRLLFFQSLLLSILISLPALSEQTCVRSASGKVVCGELVLKKKTPSTASASPKNVIKTKAGVEFALDSCKKSNTGLLCSISIYNSTDYDKSLSYWTGMAFSIIDSEGNAYKTSPTSNSTIGNQGFTATLPPKIRTKSFVTFRPSGRLSDNLRIFKMPVIVEGVRFDIVFRDFQVS